MQLRVHLFIHGIVQGVCFRMAVVDEAEKEGVHGWVMNLPDGGIESIIEGDQEAVGRLIEFCRHGPRHAIVDSLIVKEEACKGDFNDFKIRY
jgi:acylphosphatase